MSLDSHQTQVSLSKNGAKSSSQNVQTLRRPVCRWSLLLLVFIFISLWIGDQKHCNDRYNHSFHRSCSRWCRWHQWRPNTIRVLYLVRFACSRLGDRRIHGSHLKQSQRDPRWQCHWDFNWTYCWECCWISGWSSSKGGDQHSLRDQAPWLLEARSGGARHLFSFQGTHSGTANHHNYNGAHWED